MIIPSVDIQNGNAVQLVGGKDLEIDAGDPRPIAQRFGLAGETAVIDLDAAVGTGSNTETIRELLGVAPCRVGGGIRDAQTAIDWLDAGARKVILGTAAHEQVLRELPRERVIVALDARDGEIVTEGWVTKTGQRVEDRIVELRDLVWGFLVTFVEREGQLKGLPWDRVEMLAQLAGGARLTVAGGVKTPEDIARADALGVDTQVGMALYKGVFDLAQGFSAPLTSDRPDGLWPTIVTDPQGRTLGLVYSNLDSLRASINERRGVYYSRSRQGLWRKGETSGAVQDLLAVDVDCDRDALQFTVRQRGSGFCHTGSSTCFGAKNGLAALDKTIAARIDSAPEGSYTKRLMTEEGLIRDKLVEEAIELAESSRGAHAADEAADLIYFALVAARSKGASLETIESRLDARALKVTRRKGDAKPSTAQGATR